MTFLTKMMATHRLYNYTYGGASKTYSIHKLLHSRPQQVSILGQIKESAEDIELQTFSSNSIDSINLGFRNIRIMMP